MQSGRPKASLASQKNAVNENDGHPGFLEKGGIMCNRLSRWLVIATVAFLVGGCGGMRKQEPYPWQLNHVVKSVQHSVVTVVAFGHNGEVIQFGSGFFIDHQGILVTNEHVLNGAYHAEIKTAEGNKYPVLEVIAHDALIDLIKVRVQIPSDKFVPVEQVDEVHAPAIADRVVVIGSPMGLEQTISEGIVSAVREHPSSGSIYQLTAPISQGSSGGPVLNLRGRVIGVVTFQAASGQNLNFAVSVKALERMAHEPEPLTLSQWTLQKTVGDPAQVISLCREGGRLSIAGNYDAALDFYQQATETNPESPDAWRGLGSCYIGLDQPDAAIDAFNRSIDAAPDNVAGHFVLAMYYKALERYPQAILALLQVIHIDPRNVHARYELADVYGLIDETDNQLEVFEAILDLEPDHVPTLHRMGQTVSRIGRHDEALAFLNKASDLAPENARIHFDIGLAYRSKNLPDEEFKAYTRAIRANPQMVPAHYHLGLLFLKRGDHHLALQQYTILKSLDEETSDRLFKKIYP
jgi:tetratricopeptide (TPR) repeat protein